MAANSFLNIEILIVILFSISVPSQPASISTTGNDNQAQPQLTRLEIESCTCLPSTSKCEVTISSGILSGFTCQPDQHYCCSISKKEPEIKKIETEPPKVWVVLPTVTEKVVITRKTKPASTKNGTNYQCNCKLRTDCPEEYQDFTFSYGNDCPIDKLKCCEPIIEEYRFNGRLINVLNHDTKEKSTDKCLCLPKAKCRTKNDQTIRQRSTMCPGNLTECCGDFISDKSDDGFQVDQLEFDDENDSLEKIAQQPPVDAIQGGVRREPIQLPQMKIPPQVAELESTSTLPPPQLPTQYHSPNQGYNRYTPTIIQTIPDDRKQRPSHYYNGNNAPWLTKFGSSYVINNHGRGFADTGRSSQSSGSFLSTLASLLG